MTHVNKIASGPLIRVAHEMDRQDAKWGDQRQHPDGTGPDYRGLAQMAKRETDEAARNGTLTWRHILLEEMFEAFSETDPALLIEELTQCAAVCATWINAIHSREPVPTANEGQA